MDAIILNATTSFASSVPPVRTFNPTGRLRALCFAHSPKKLLFRPQNPRKLDLRCSSAGKFKITCGGVREINESQFSSTVVNSDVPVLVEFVANWCGPCRLISPVIEWVSQVRSCSFLLFKLNLNISVTNICLKFGEPTVYFCSFWCGRLVIHIQHFVCWPLCTV